MSFDPSIFNRPTFNEIVGDLSSLNVADLQVDELDTDIIAGLTTSTQLTFLATMVTSINAAFLGDLDQDVGVGANPIFSTLRLYDSLADHSYRFLSVVNLAANRDCFLPLLAADDTFVFQDFEQTLTNKTISRSVNTLTNLNIVNADVSASAAIGLTKLQAHVYDSTNANLGIGTNALDSVSVGVGIQNLAFGDNSLDALTTADQCVAIGKSALASVTTNGGNLGLGFQCMKGLGGNVLAINNTAVGNNIWTVANTADCHGNFLFGGGILLSGTGASSNNIFMGVENMRFVTTGACSNNVSLGYRNMFNLTTGTLNNSLLLGDLINAPAATSILSNIAVLGARNITLRATPLVNYLQLGDSSKTELYIPITSLNTNGILISSSNVISSATTIPGTFTIGGVVLSGETVQVDALFLVALTSLKQLTLKADDGQVIDATVIFPPGVNNLSEVICSNTNQGMSNKYIVDTLLCDTINEYTAGNGVTLDGVKCKDSEVYTDVIHEKTAAAGVTVDGLLCKDGSATFTTGGGGVPQTALAKYEETTHTTTWTSTIWSAAQQGNFQLTKIGNQVTFTLPLNYSLSNGSGNGYISNTTALPTRFRPSVTVWGMIPVVEGGTNHHGEYQISTGGVVTISKAFIQFVKDGTLAGYHGFSATYLVSSQS